MGVRSPLDPTGYSGLSLLNRSSVVDIGLIIVMAAGSCAGLGVGLGLCFCALVALLVFGDPRRGR